jgi:predicted thioesterase
MTPRNELVATRDWSGAHVDGKRFVYGTAMMIPAMEIASGAAVPAALARGLGDGRQRDQYPPSRAGSGGPHGCGHGPFHRSRGRSVLFAVEAHDGVRKVGEEGTHHRGALHLERFLKRAGS